MTRYANKANRYTKQTADQTTHDSSWLLDDCDFEATGIVFFFHYTVIWVCISLVSWTIWYYCGIYDDNLNDIETGMEADFSMRLELPV